MARIYVAGPLFNAPERDELDQITAVLEAAGHTCFLPQRDGMDIDALAIEMAAQGATTEVIQKTVLATVFDLDMFMLLNNSDIIVANLNGRVPDEGTIAEAAVAWHAHKPVVLYKADARIVMQGGDNPLLSGLSEFKMVSVIADLPQAVADALTKSEDLVRQAVARGAAIAKARAETPDMKEFAARLLNDFVQ